MGRYNKEIEIQDIANDFTQQIGSVMGDFSSHSYDVGRIRFQESIWWLQAAARESGKQAVRDIIAVKKRRGRKKA